MNAKKIWNIIVYTGLIWIIKTSDIWAENVQDLDTASNDFSDKMLKMFKGPLVKIVAGIVLFMGVGGLIRGRHQVALSCGIAFVLLLLLPVILGYFGAQK